MNIKYAAIVSLMATGFVSCRSADLVQAGPEPATVRQQRVQELNRRVQLDVANAGCALGLSSGVGGSRVIMLQRDRLPFKLPTLTLPANSVRSWRMQVARVSIPLSAPRSSSALLACLVPMNGSAVDSLKKAVAQTTAEDWSKFASQVADEGSQRASNLYREVEQVLLDSTLKSGWTSTLAAPLSSMRAAAMSDPRPLATVHVTASANVVVYSISIPDATLQRS